MLHNLQALDVKKGSLFTEKMVFPNMNIQIRNRTGRNFLDLDHDTKTPHD